MLFSAEEIGEIQASEDWSFSENNHEDPEYKKHYTVNTGYKRVQGKGIARGRLFGGHGGLIEYDKDSCIQLSSAAFDDTILFFEDIAEISTVEYISNFFDTLGRCGYLQRVNGIIIGKMCLEDDYEQFEDWTFFPYLYVAIRCKGRNRC